MISVFCAYLFIEICFEIKFWEKFSFKLFYLCLPNTFCYDNSTTNEFRNQIKTKDLKLKKLRLRKKRYLTHCQCDMKALST